MINLDTLMAVQAELTRFQTTLDAVRAAERKRYKEAEARHQEDVRQGKFYTPPALGAYSGGPATAALRRASMDLTRALAELRR